MSQGTEVHLVIRRIPHESSDVVGVFSDVERALDFRDTQQSKCKWADFIIETWEVVE